MALTQQYLTTLLSTCLLAACENWPMSPNSNPMPVCKANTDCPSGLCYDSGGSQAMCIAKDDPLLIYVDARSPGCPMYEGLGTFARPYCEIQKGIEERVGKNPTQEYRFLVRPGRYKSVYIIQGKVTLIGPSADPALVGPGKPDWDQPPPSDKAVIMASMMMQPALYLNLARERDIDVTVDGFALDWSADQPGEGGVQLDHSTSTRDQMPQLRFVLRRSTIIQPQYYGLRAFSKPIPLHPISIELDRVRVSGARMWMNDMRYGNGLTLFDVATLSIKNSLIDHNDFYAIFVHASAGPLTLREFNHNSIVENGAKLTGYPAAIYCNPGEVTGVLKNSIIYKNSEDVKGRQISYVPMISNVIFGTADQTLSPGTPKLIECDPIFMGGTGAGSYKLRGECGKDRASQPLSVDFFGQPRPADKADVGMHESEQ